MRSRRSRPAASASAGARALAAAAECRAGAVRRDRTARRLIPAARHGRRNPIAQGREGCRCWRRRNAGVSASARSPRFPRPDATATARFGRRCRKLRGGGHHMDNAKAACFQLMQNSGQGSDGSRLDVVQQQNASSFGLDPLDRQVVDPRRRNMPPVVCRKIGAPGLEALRGEIVFDGVGAHPARECGRTAQVPSSSPRAAFTDAIPSSISCLARSIGIRFMVSG